MKLYAVTRDYTDNRTGRHAGSGNPAIFSTRERAVAFMRETAKTYTHATDATASESTFFNGVENVFRVTIVRPLCEDVLLRLVERTLDADM